MQMKLSRVKEILPDAQVLNFKNREIKSITVDSRRVREGSLFVAMGGTATDGELYVEDAVSRGAVAVIAKSKHNINVPLWICEDTTKALALLCAELYGHPEQKIHLAGITGTNGKTTTAFLLKSILEANEKRVGLIGTIKYEIGERIIPGDMTTPSIADLYDYLAQMVGAGIEWCVMEISSHGLSQRRSEGLKFDAAVFTNLSQDHLDYHKDMDDYFNAKSLLFRGLTDSAVAALNADDEYGRKMAKLTNAKKITFGLAEGAQVTAKILEMTPQGTRCELSYNGEKVAVSSALIGSYNVSNILAAATAAIGLGIDLKTIKKGIENLSGVPGRIEKVECDLGFTVVVDYAHTDDALDKLLTTLRELTTGKLIVVFGCGGDRDTKKRAKMGAVVSRLADTFVVTSDNPRTESPERIINMILEGIDKSKSYKVEVDRYKAIEEALKMAGKGDIVVIAGKGHETYQRFTDHVKFFDDRVVAREILKNIG